MAVLLSFSYCASSVVVDRRRVELSVACVPCRSTSRAWSSEDLAAQPRPVSSRACVKMASSIASVSTPVKVFCWDG
jgi:hypothetical protein